ncbi:unnamed protein product, partial [Allacma fusca]
ELIREMIRRPMVRLFFDEDFSADFENTTEITN